MNRALTLVILISLVSITGAKPSPSDCAWGGRVYSDGDLKLNGRVCQICQAGKWIDRDAKCEECKVKNKPVISNPPPSDKDCTAQMNPSTGQKLTFSDGARLSQKDGKFQMCSAGQWFEREPAKNQLCPPE